MTAEYPLQGLISTALPEMRFLTRSAEVEAHRRDATEYQSPGRALGIAFPRSTDEVRTLVTVAAEHEVPLVPRGAGTGLSGGAVAVDGAITIVLTEMDRILEIDPDNLLVVTHPGVINADLGAAVAERGLFYPPNPAPTRSAPSAATSPRTPVACAA